MNKIMMKYNLQFFAEGESDDNNDDSTKVIDNTSSSSNSGEGQVDTEAFAELISERDTRIDELEREVKSLKKSNADLLVKISSGNRTEKSFEEKLLNLVGDSPRKE